MGYQLGIDVGTTYTAAAVCRSTDRRWVEPEVVTLGTRSATVPSVLCVAPDGAVLVGEAAERRSLTDPDRVVREFKRRIGDPTPVLLAGRAWAPEELSARLVRWVVDRVSEREGGPPSRIAVTHPASWGVHKRDLLGAALAAQGLGVTFLAEPQAAALHYATAERIGPGSAIAVYDLGGGTFDAAVVRKGDPGGAAAGAAGFGLLGRPEGLERLGGVDFDEVVFDHVREGLPAAFAGLDDTDPEVLSAMSRVRRECTEAKEALSSDTEVSIPVLMPASRGSVRLHRSEFEAMIRSRLEETVAALRKAVASAGLEPAQLTAVLLVGGSSRIPLVAQLVSEQIGRPVAVDADPKNAIAKGAALAVSPKPTASWPGVAIPTVPAAAAVGAGAVGAFGGAGFGAAAPARPPRPRVSLPPHELDRPGTPPRGLSHSAQVAPATPASRGPGGPSHEPATSLLSTVGSAARPSVLPPPDDEWDYEPEPMPETRRRPLGLLVAVGALLAVAAVVVSVLLVRESAPIGTSQSPAGDAVPAEVVPSDDPPAVPPSEEPGAGPPADEQDGAGPENPTGARPTSAPAAEKPPVPNPGGGDSPDPDSPAPDADPPADDGPEPTTQPEPTPSPEPPADDGTDPESNGGGGLDDLLGGNRGTESNGETGTEAAAPPATGGTTPPGGDDTAEGAEIENAVPAVS